MRRRGILAIVQPPACARCGELPAARCECGAACCAVCDRAGAGQVSCPQCRPDEGGSNVRAELLRAGLALGALLAWSAFAVLVVGG